MKFFKKFILTIAVLMLISVGLFVFVINFSTTASSYKCIGELASEGKSEEKTIYIVLEEYRWWVGLWSDSIATLHAEVPGKIFNYYHHIEEAGTQLLIYDGHRKSPRGHFSKLSGTLSLKTNDGFFDGTCTSIEPL